MKSFIKYIGIILIVVNNFAFSQNNVDEQIKKAMQDEIEQNIKELALPDLQKPFFISYQICNAKTLYINARLGSIIKLAEQPYCSLKTRVLVGNNKHTNENFLDMNTLWNWERKYNLPLNMDYTGLRIEMWKATDKKYKKAAEQYEAKI